MDDRQPPLEAPSTPRDPVGVRPLAKCPNRTCRSPFVLFGADVFVVPLDNPTEKYQRGVALVCSICQTPFIVTEYGVELCMPQLGVENQVRQQVQPPELKEPAPVEPDDARWPRRRRPNAGPAR